MGTNYAMDERKFSIPAEKVEAALAAFEAMGSGYYDELDKVKARIDHYKHLPPAIKLSELSGAAWGFELKLDEDEKRVVDVEWVWETCAEPDLFEALAPFVDEGSFIEMRSEDGSRWRWEFKGGKLSKLKAQTKWQGAADDA